MTCCSTTPRTCCTSAQSADVFERVSALNTLAFSAGLCINCGMCVAVCPHGVFVPGSGTGTGVQRTRGKAQRVRTPVRIVQADACMECGACALNCPTGALQVDSGVGCAAAMINAALRGLDEPTCGGADGCCG